MRGQITEAEREYSVPASPKWSYLSGISVIAEYLRIAQRSSHWSVGDRSAKYVSLDMREGLSTERQSQP